MMFWQNPAVLVSGQNFCMCLCVFQSGAIMTILAAVCTKMPEAKLAIIFLPMFTFTAANVRHTLSVCLSVSLSVSLCLCTCFVASLS